MLESALMRFPSEFNLLFVACCLFLGVPSWSVTHKSLCSRLAFDSTKLVRALQEKYLSQREHLRALERDSFYREMILQPKKEISDYVENHGFQVPIRFSSLNAALAKGVPFIIRTEHPVEYFGPSGLGDSLLVGRAVFSLMRKVTKARSYSIDWAIFHRAKRSTIGLSYEERRESRKDSVLAKLLAGYLNKIYSEKDLIEGLLKLTDNGFALFEKLHPGIELKYTKGLSFSFWEFLPGINRSVVADSSREGVYHIFSTEFSAEGNINWHNYTIFDNGKIKRYSDHDFVEDARNLLGLIKEYEAIRGLGFFDADHVPMMEFQTNKGVNYFLQYHRTRNFYPAKYKLQRTPEKGELIADFVRGITPPEGIVVKVSFRSNQLRFTPEDEASFDIHYNNLYTEVQSRIRKVNFIVKGLNEIGYFSSDKGHFLRSSLFKPELSVVLGEGSFDKLVPEAIRQGLVSKSRELGLLYHIKVRVVSDGEKAFLKLIDSP